MDEMISDLELELDKVERSTNPQVEYSHFTHEKLLKSKMPSYTGKLQREMDRMRNTVIQIYVFFAVLLNSVKINIVVYNKMIYWIEKLRLLEPLKVQDQYRITKLFSGISKKFGYQFDGEWELFVDWQMCVGFNLRNNDVNILSKVHDWCSGIKEYSAPKGHYGTIVSDFIYKDLSSVNSKPNPHALTFNDFIRKSRKWITSGVAYDAAVEVRDVGKNKIVKSQQNKWTFALLYTPNEIIKMVNETERSEYRSAVKVELGGRARIFIIGDVIQQITQSYVSYLVEPRIRDVVSYFLWYSNSAQIEWYKQRVRDLRSGDWTFAPIDASSFDQNVGTDEVNAVFSALRKLLLRWEGIYASEGIKYLDKIRSMFWAARVRVVNQPRSPPTYVDWEHGVPSGIRWTALIDTLVNIGRARFILNTSFPDPRLSDKAEGLKPNNAVKLGKATVVGMGDDDAFKFRNAADADLCVDLYNRQGYGVHPAKNFTDNKRDEFLRKVTIFNGVKGYFTRKIQGNYFRNPTARPPSIGKARVSEAVKQWNVGLSRYDNDYFRQQMLTNVYSLISKAKGFGYKGFEVLHTPATVGGIGLYPFCDDWYILQELTVEENELNFEYTGPLRTIGSSYEHQARITGYPVDYDTIYKTVSAVSAPKDGPLFKDKDVYVTKYDETIKVLFPPIKSTFENTAPNAHKPSLRGEYAWMDQEMLARSIIDSEKWSDVTVYFTQSTSNTFFDLKRRTKQKAVYISWLTGKWPQHTPIITGWADNVIADTYNRVFNYYFQYVLSSNKSIIMRHIYEICLSVEVQTCYSLTNLYDYRLSA